MDVSLLLLLLVVVTRVYAAQYDQRQTGEVNVQLDLRNIEVLAILGDYDMYADYEDYPEIHVPPEVSGSSPTTEGENVGLQQNETVSVNSTTATTSPPTSQPDTPVLKMPSSTRRCSEGYFRDRRGRCRKERPALNLPFGLRLAPRVRRTK